MNLEADAELTQAYLGWHGLNLGQIGIGPAILHQNAELSGVEIAGSPADFSAMCKTTFAGVLMRTETDQFDFTAAVGIDAGSDGWKNGTGLLIGAGFHVSDAFTQPGGCNRSWGDFEDGTEVKENIFSLGGCYRIADSAFVEGAALRTKCSVSYDCSSTAF